LCAQHAAGACFSYGSRGAVSFVCRDAFNALGTDRSFNLPEYYWRISRNQTGANGQYCSEIHRTDWDDM